MYTNYNNEYNRAYPDYDTNANSLYAPTPYPQPQPKKERKVPKYIAAAVAIALIAGGAGGGAGWWAASQATAAAPAAVTQPVHPTSSQTTPLPAASNDVAQVVQKASASVVEIVTEQTQNNPFALRSTVGGAGSGVILTEDGYIVTNDHVVADAQTISVRTQDGTEYPAQLVGTDAKTDLAVIKVEATSLQPAALADSDSIQVGALAVAIGNPLGELGGTVTSGIISATSREITIGDETMQLLQTSAAVNPGNSGGGLFDGNGNLVGVVNAKSSGVGIEGLAFAIPSNTVKKVTDDIINSGYVTGRPQMGISILEISDGRTAMMYRVNSTGVFVATAEKGVSLQSGDRFVSIEGTEITSASDISSVLAQHAVGDTLSVTVERDGKDTTVAVVLTERVPEGIEKIQSEV